jgi:serine/threonine protein kinase
VAIPSFGHFEDIAELGQGGMGKVYSAHDPRTDRRVALKVLPEEFARDPERLARFQREAKVLGSLNHPNIATLFGVDEFEGHPYLIMELAQGKDLHETLKEGPLSLDQSLNIALQIAQGLEEAHEKGVIHRDLKPANIMVGPDGTVKILDFGLAQAYEGESTGESDSLNSPTITAALTSAGTILGTAAYMSPEQARGRGIDRRSDLWAFGVVFWEMLTGKRLFQGETVSDTLAEILKTTPPWSDLPADTPHGVRRLLERCLERDVQNRLRDIGEARIRLQKWEADPSQLDNSFGSYAVTQSERRRGSWMPWTVAGIACVAALALAFGLLPSNEAQTPPLTMSLRLADDENMSTTVNEGLEFSDDGNYFMWTTPAGLHLQHRSNTQSTLIPLVGTTIIARFSPNSKWIAVTHAAQLSRVSVTGGNLIKICDAENPRGLDWVDEKTIVIASSFAGPLDLISVESGEKKQLTESGDQERSHRWPSVIPGTRKVLFMTHFTGRDYQDSDIESVDVDTGERKVVYSGGSYPQYSPTGHILFAKNSSIFAVNYDLKSQTTTGLAIPVLDNVLTRVADQELDDGSAQFTFDQTGNMLYRHFDIQKQAQSRLAWLDLESGEVETFGEVNIYGTLVISPDGNFIAYRRGEGADSEVVVLNLISGSNLVISDRKGMKYGGAWSPDSEHYYWAAANLLGTGFEILKAHRQGGSAPEAIYTMANTSYTSDITPDGRWLFMFVYTTNNEWEINYIDLTNPDTPAIPYQSGPGEQSSYGLDPTGKFVLINDSSSSIDHLFLTRFPDTGDRWSIGTGGRDYDEYHWAPDGSGIYLRNSQTLDFLPVSLGESIEIGNTFKFVVAEPGISQKDTKKMSFHPDGKRAIILIPETSSDSENRAEVILQTHWFAEVERIMNRN